MNSSGKHDLKHFLSLACAQLQFRLKQVEAQEPYSERIRQLRLLEELIKEQVPNYAADSRTSASKAG